MWIVLAFAAAAFPFCRWALLCHLLPFLVEGKDLYIACFRRDMLAAEDITLWPYTLPFS